MDVRDVESEVKQDEMPTLSGMMNKAMKDGYREAFKVDSKGLTTVEDKDPKHYKAEDIHIVNFHRFEGFSDPMDNCILYLIETADGRKGTLVDAYGAYSDAKQSEFIKTVEDIHKEQPKKI